MTVAPLSLDDILRASSHALVVGVGGGGDVAGAFAAAKFLEFCGLRFTLGGLSWERLVYDPIPGPRKLDEVINVRALHPRAWMAGAASQTATGVLFAEARMAEFLGSEVLLVDINGGVQGVVAGMAAAIEELKPDLLVGLDVGGDSLAQGHEPGLRSPLADSIMLAAYVELEKRGHRVLWGIFGYGSDGELSLDEIEMALNKIAGAGGWLGATALTPKIVAELEEVIKHVPTEASAIPVECFRGAWGARRIRDGQRNLKLTPLTALTFFVAPTSVYATLSRPAQAVRASVSLDEANDALHRLNIHTELDYEREQANLRAR